MEPKLESKIGKTKSVYSYGDYKLTFSNRRAPNKQSRDLCDIKMFNGKDVVWQFYYLHSGDHASLGDLKTGSGSKPRTFKSTRELDFLFHCLEDYFYKTGIKTVLGRTNPVFGRFLNKRGWKNLVKKESFLDVEKRITKKGNKPIGAFRKKRKGH
jgi:hypothetical protein